MRGPGKSLFALVAAFVVAPLIVAAGIGIDEIEYYHRVNDQVALGGQPTPAQVVALAQAGFSTIINLREESEFDAQPDVDAATDAGLRYIRIPISKPAPTNEQVKEFLLVTDNAGIYPAFIHCATANRAAALWMVRLVLHDGWSLETAEKEAAQNGLTSEALREFAREYIRSHGGGKQGS
jgi:uncharacterized protein (TIGR01244 family)